MTMTDIAMTGAQLRSFREYLGLSLVDMCRYLDVRQRDLERMEAGQLPIHDGIAGEVRDLLHSADAMVEKLVESYKAGEIIELTTYRTDRDFETVVFDTDDVDLPARWHRQICARVAAQVPEIGIVYARVEG